MERQNEGKLTRLRVGTQICTGSARLCASSLADDLETAAGMRDDLAQQPTSRRRPSSNVVQHPWDSNEGSEAGDVSVTGAGLSISTNAVSSAWANCFGAFRSSLWPVSALLRPSANANVMRTRVLAAAVRNLARVDYNKPCQ